MVATGLPPLQKQRWAEAGLKRRGKRLGEGRDLCRENPVDKRQKEQRERGWGNMTEQMHRLSAPTSNKIPECKPTAMTNPKLRTGLWKGLCCCNQRAEVKPF